MTTMTQSHATVKTTTIFDSADKARFRNRLYDFGKGLKGYADPRRMSAMYDALMKASAPKLAAKPVVVAPVSVRNWPTASEVDSRWVTETYSAEEIRLAREWNITPDEVRDELANFEAFERLCDPSPAEMESQEYDEARMVAPIVTEDDCRRPVRRRRTNAAAARRRAVA